MKSFYLRHPVHVGWEEILIDEDDYERVIKHKWYIYKVGSGCEYTVMRRIKPSGCVHLSRFILNVTDSKVFVDHKNHNRYDNRKENLRIASRSQNGWNSKPNRGRKYKGTTFNKIHKKWMAQIVYKTKIMQLGYFSSEIEAARAYDEAAKEYHGEFAYLNFPESNKNKNE